jgi:hypothetical protein
MVAQDKLGRMFVRGETSGEASNVRIIHFPYLGKTALVGYGHAVYATRDDDTGHITYFEGWYGYSPSTSCQLTKMGFPSVADSIENRQAKRGELRREDKQFRLATMEAEAAD